MTGLTSQPPMSVSAPQSFTVEVASRLLARALHNAPYRLRRAACEADLRAAQTLRFLVFNVELNEGLESSYATFRDEDPFDPICDHLLVEDKRTGDVVGTYRLQTGTTAARNRGFYSEQEFDFTPLRPLQDQMVELGRACVHSEHRGLPVLGLLWRGIIAYAKEHQARYLVGCSSITSQDPKIGASAFLELSREHLVETAIRTVPLPHYVCPMDQLSPTVPKIPKLLRAYLALGSKICGPPAIDREFKTIDFLTWMDLETLPEISRPVLG